MTGDIMTTREVAEYLGRPIGTVRNWIRDGRFGPKPASCSTERSLYFRKKDVDFWLQKECPRRLEFLKLKGAEI